MLQSPCVHFTHLFGTRDRCTHALRGSSLAMIGKCQAPQSHVHPPSVRRSWSTASMASMAPMAAVDAIASRGAEASLNRWSRLGLFVMVKKMVQCASIGLAEARRNTKMNGLLSMMYWDMNILGNWLCSLRVLAPKDPEVRDGWTRLMTNILKDCRVSKAGGLAVFCAQQSQQRLVERWRHPRKYNKVMIMATETSLTLPFTQTQTPIYFLLGSTKGWCGCYACTDGFGVLNWR